MKKIIIILLASCILLLGYMLSIEDEDRDVIKYNGHIYSNVTELEWFKESKNNFSKGEKIGEIKTSLLFLGNFSATKLPKGTALYGTNNGEAGLIIVENEKGEFLYYMIQLKE